MPRRKGELTPAEIDRTYPHQIALFVELFLGKLEQAAVCHANHLPARTSGRRRGSELQCLLLHCKAARGAFQELGGEPFDRRDRGGRKLDEWFNAKLRYGSDLLRDEHTLLHFLLGAGILYASSEFRATCIATRLIETGGQRPQLATR